MESLFNDVSSLFLVADVRLSAGEMLDFHVVRSMPHHSVKLRLLAVLAPA